MIKICFVTTVSMTLKYFVLDVSKYLYNNGQYDITFICNNDDEFKDSLPSYIHYIPLPMKRGISLNGFFSTYKLYKIFKKNHFDLVQYSTPNASLYASISSYLSKIPIRLYCQWGIHYVSYKGIKRLIFKEFEKIICKLSTNIQPDSFGNLNFSISEKLYQSYKGDVIWNGSACGLDLERFNIDNKEYWRNLIRNKYGIENNFVFGFVGRIKKDKGIVELLESFRLLLKKYPYIFLLLIGPIEDSKKVLNKDLLDWSKNCKNILFCGLVRDIEKYYSAMDVFVLPSYREGFGSVIIEAQSMGIPVVVTNIPGPTEAMKKDYTGIIVEKKNVEQLFNAMETLLNDTNMRMMFSLNAEKFARKNFNSTIFKEKVLENRNKLLKKVIEK